MPQNANCRIRYDRGDLVFRLARSWNRQTFSNCNCHWFCLILAVPIFSDAFLLLLVGAYRHLSKAGKLACTLINHPQNVGQKFDIEPKVHMPSWTIEPLKLQWINDRLSVWPVISTPLKPFSRFRNTTMVCSISLANVYAQRNLNNMDNCKWIGRATRITQYFVFQIRVIWGVKHALCTGLIHMGSWQWL